MPVTGEFEDVTEVIRRHRSNKLISMVIGLGIAVCSTGGSYFAYRKAKEEARAATVGVQREAAAGYSTLINPVTLMLELGKSCDERITAVEAQVRELKSRQSLSAVGSIISTPAAPSLGLVPLDRARLYRPLPRTLGEAAAATQ